MLLYNEIAGATSAGFVTTLVGHPLDTIKVHLQTQPTTSASDGTWKTGRTLWAQNALFRGIVPPLVNAVVMNTVMFAAFHSVKDLCGDSLTAGLLSGFATACISTPTDYIKIQAQLHGKSSWGLVQKTLVNHPRNFLRGHTANLGREGVFTMVYLGLYDRMQPKDFFQVALTGSLTGAFAWIASYPFDTLKSVMQAKTTSIPNALKSIYERGGLAAFYRGCLPSTGRAMLVTSLRMITYEAEQNGVRHENYLLFSICDEQRRIQKVAVGSMREERSPTIDKSSRLSNEQPKEGAKVRVMWSMGVCVGGHSRLLWSFPLIAFFDTNQSPPRRVDIIS
eukprot:scaffold425_cov175-Amphora_coffeaeformis.AAC.92